MAKETVEVRFPGARERAGQFAVACLRCLLLDLERVCALLVILESLSSTSELQRDAKCVNGMRAPSLKL